MREAAWAGRNAMATIAKGRSLVFILKRCSISSSRLQVEIHRAWDLVRVGVVKVLRRSRGSAPAIDDHTEASPDGRMFEAARRGTAESGRCPRSKGWVVPTTIVKNASSYNLSSPDDHFRPGPHSRMAVPCRRSPRCGQKAPPVG